MAVCVAFGCRGRGGLAAVVWPLGSADAQRGRHEHGFSYWRCFALVAILVWTSWLAGLFSAPHPDYFNYTGVHTFAVRLGDEWKHIEAGNEPELKDEGHPLAMVRHRFQAAADKSTLFVVMALPRELPDGSHPVLSTVNDIMGFTTLSPMPMTFAGRDDAEAASHGAGQAKPWQSGEVDGRTPSGKIVRALYWKKEIITPSHVTNTDWYLACTYRAESETKSRALCETFRERLVLWNVSRPSAAAKLVFSSLIWVGAIALALALLRVAPGWRGGVEFFVFVAAVAAARGAGSFSERVGGGYESADLSGGILTAVLFLACIAYATASVAHWRKPSSPLAAARHVCESFLASTIAAAILFILYVYAAEGSEHSHAIRGAIVCVALTWELWMSGAAVTNKDTPLMPRGARVTALIGYLVLVAACTFFFVTTSMAYNERTWLGFDTETLVAAGITCLGIPYLLLRHFDRFRRAVPDTYRFT